MIRLIYLWFIVAAFLISCADEQDSGADADTDSGWQTGTLSRQIEIDGMSRTYELHVADSTAAAMLDGPVPLLFALHGAGDTGLAFLTWTDLIQCAEDNGFLLVGPDAYNRSWFLQDFEGWPQTDGYINSLINDMLLVLAIIDEIAQEYELDDRRIYAAGHSRGAGFTVLLAILSGQFEFSSVPYTSPFAAYGVNAGYNPMSSSFDAMPTEPKRPVWVIHGGLDPVVLLTSGEALVAQLDEGGWDYTFTIIENTFHTWLWDPICDMSNQDLWDFFLENPLP